MPRGANTTSQTQQRTYSLRSKNPPPARPPSPQLVDPPDGARPARCYGYVEAVGSGNGAASNPPPAPGHQSAGGASKRGPNQKQLSAAAQGALQRKKASQKPPLVDVGPSKSGVLKRKVSASAGSKRPKLSGASPLSDRRKDQPASPDSGWEGIPGADLLHPVVAQDPSSPEARPAKQARFLYQSPPSPVVLSSPSPPPRRTIPMPPTQTASLPAAATTTPARSCATSLADLATPPSHQTELLSYTRSLPAERVLSCLRSGWITFIALIHFAPSRCKGPGVKSYSDTRNQPSLVVGGGGTFTFYRLYRS